MAGFDESELLVCRGDSGPGLETLAMAGFDGGELAYRACGLGAVLDLLERISRHEKVDPSEIRAGISAIRSAIGGGL